MYVLTFNFFDLARSSAALSVLVSSPKSGKVTTSASPSSTRETDMLTSFTVNHPINPLPFVSVLSIDLDFHVPLKTMLPGKG